QFAGAWIGSWGGDVCTTLVVEEVFASGVARVVYSRGTAAALKIYQPRYWRVTGRIRDDVLRFKLPVLDRPDFEYRYRSDTGTLAGTRPPRTRHPQTSPPRPPAHAPASRPPAD